MIKIFSFGGGVQSTAALILAAQGKIDYSEFVFCNVGDDSENPATLQYFHEYSMPYAKRHGLILHEIHKTKRDGTRVTLLEQLTKPDSRSIGIPVRMAKSGAPGRRSCTVEYKVKLCDQFIKKNHGIGRLLQKERGYAQMAKAIKGQMLRAGHDPQQAEAHYLSTLSMIKMPRPLVTIALGISLDEWHRAKNSSGIEWKALDYPLLNLKLTRNDCKQIILDAGEPVPPPSSCWFCPMHTTQRWQEIKRETPPLFEGTADLEELLISRRLRLGRDPIYFHHSLIPLRLAITDQPISAEETAQQEQEQCLTGGCFL